MSYQVDIPQELRPKIIEYINNSQRSVNWKHEHIKFLMTVFYRYVQKLGRYKSVEEKVKARIRCGDCRNEMLEYFEHQCDVWEGKAW